MNTSAARSELLLLILFDELQVPIYLDKLKKCGYQNVISCTQGEEAIKKLTSGEFSLVITDTELKGKMNGIDLGRKVRQEFNLPLIYLSRLQDETTLDRALETKPRAFLSIPVNWNELRVAIESAIFYNDEIESLNSVINEFKQRFEEAPLPYQILNGDGRLTSVNKAWVILMGYSVNEVIGKWFGDFMKEWFHPAFKQCLDTAKKTGSIHDLECDLLRKDGHSITIAFEGSVQYGLQKEIHSIRCVLNDITERQKIKENLLESEKRFRILFEEAPLGYQSLAANGIIIYVNNTWCKMLGYSKKEAIGMWFGDFLAPEERKRFIENFSVFRQKGEAYNIKYKMIRKDGEAIYIIIDGIVRYDEEDKYIQSHFILKDITAQKFVEDALLESEKRFRNLIESAGDNIYVLDHDLKYVYGNKQYLKRRGLTQEELIGKEYGDFHSDERKSEFKKEVMTVYEAENSISYEYQSETDGKYFLRTISPVMDFETNKFESITVISKDITGLKKAEQALLNRENEIRTITDNIPALVSYINADGHYSFVNQQYKKWFGIPSKEIIGKHIREVTGEIAYKQIIDYVDKALSGQRITFDTELNYVHGGTRWVTAEYIPDLDDKGKVSGFFALIVDVTERKRAEEMLKKTAQLLTDTGEMAQVGGWELDFSTREILFTEAVCRIHGVEPGYRLMLDEALNFYAPESRPEVEAVVKKAAETGKPYILESLFIPRGSTEKIWVRSIGKAVYTGGKLVKLTGTFQNIDKYKKAEEAIRNLAKFPSEDPDPVLRVDLDGRLLYANEASFKFLTWKLQIGKKTPSVLQKIIAEALKEGNRKIIETEHNQRFISFSIVPVVEEGYANLYGRDITERKRIEKALEESEAMLRIINKNISDLIWRIDADTRITYLSPSVERILGYRPEEISGQPILNFIAKEYHHFAAKNIRERASKVKGNKLIYFEYEMVAKDGRKIPIEVSSSAIHDDQGNLTGFAGVSRDISERKTAEIALKESEVQYKDLVEKAGVAIIIDDMEGKLIYANREFSRLFGYTMKEINKLTHRDLIHPDDFERVNNIHRRRILGERAPTSYEFRSVKKNGNFFWTEIKVTSLKRNGKFTGTRSYIWDIDQRKKTEKTLRYSEARFRELFSNMSSGVAIYEYVPDQAEFIFRDMNEAGFRITRITDKEKVIGRDILAVYPSAKSIGLTDMMRKVMKSGKSGRLSASLYKDDRIELYVDYQIYKLPTGEIVSIFDDITERIVAEQDIWRNYEEIKKLTQHIETVREEERQMIARDLHDDLGQILTAVKMDISWIRNQIPSDQKLIKKRAESSIQIIDQAIQSIRRISSELRPVILDDLGLFQALIVFLRDFEKRTGIKILHDLPEIEHEMSPEKLISVFRIIQETMTNIARHSGASIVNLKLSKKKNNLEILIKDNGIGISDDAINSPESFGLISMRERVLQWGGNINIRGKANEGTTIRVNIPAIEL